jgi:hypothetical protein
MVSPADKEICKADFALINKVAGFSLMQRRILVKSSQA